MQLLCVIQIRKRHLLSEIKIKETHEHYYEVYADV